MVTSISKLWSNMFVMIAKYPVIFVPMNCLSNISYCESHFLFINLHEPAEQTKTWQLMCFNSMASEMSLFVWSAEPGMKVLNCHVIF